ncbi:MAG: ankyrin repeat domain-containing protein [Burkholderiales bacterium]
MTQEKLDFLTRLRIRELVLMGLIAVTALLANLPREYVLETLGVNPDVLLAALACAVVLGLFLYLKFFFFLAVVLLIAGANMPQQVADGLHISRVPLVLALIALVGISLINHVVKLLPTGLEPRPLERSPEAVRALFYAIDRGNVVYAQKLLAMRFDPNLAHENGDTPLAHAAATGNALMVEVLLRHGADPSLATPQGDTPVEYALRHGHAEVAEMLRRARRRTTV